MHRPCDELREALALYVLGAIELADRDVVERHLADCADCRDEVAGLAGLPALLRRVSVEEATAIANGGTERGRIPPSGPALNSMMARSYRQRRRRTRTWAAAAAAAGLVAGAAVIAGWQATRPPAHQPAAAAPGWTDTSRAASQQTRATATVRYAATGWGCGSACRWPESRRARHASWRSSTAAGSR
jgi:anti-sigma factor RsiW